MKPDLIHLRGRRVCVALSGGGDSVALFHFLCGCARENGIELSAVHVEHGIRGEASRADAGFVRALCAARGVPLREVSEDVPARAAAWKAGLEEAARRCRYAAFARLLAAGEADVVATAHHAGDNAESVLFNLLRGSSLTGAGGIRAFLPYPALARLAGEDLSAGEGLPPRPAYCGVARPLLSVSQGEIAAYLRENALAFREDATNADTAYTRNFLRARVLAPARERFPAAERALYNFSRRAREDDDYLYSLAREKVACSVREGVPAAEVPADLPRPLFVRACALALRALGAEDCTSADFEAAFALTRGGSGRTACLPRGVCALREYEKVILYRPAPASLAAAESSVPEPSAPAAGSLQYPFAEGSSPLRGRCCASAAPGGRRRRASCARRGRRRTPCARRGRAGSVPSCWMSPACPTAACCAPGGRGTASKNSAAGAKNSRTFSSTASCPARCAPPSLCSPAGERCSPSAASRSRRRCA